MGSGGTEEKAEKNKRMRKMNIRKRGIRIKKRRRPDLNLPSMK